MTTKGDRCSEAVKTSASLPVWEYNVLDKTFKVNQAWCSLIDYNCDVSEVIAESDFCDLIHPDDLQCFNEELALAIKNQDTQFTIDYRIRHNNGEWKHIKSIGSICSCPKNASKNTIKAINIDLTNYHQAIDRLLYKTKMEELLGDIAAKLVDLNEDAFDNTVNELLQSIIDFAGADRAYVFLFTPDKTLMSNTHESCAPGISKEIDNLQEIPVTSIPWWTTKVLKKEHIYLRTLENLPEEACIEKEILSQQNIVSLLVLPIYYQDNVMGFLGFDSVNREKIWTQSDIYLLKAIGKTMGSSLNAFKTKLEIIEAKNRAEENAMLKTAFLNNLSHEIRTPMNGIMGFSELIQMDPDKPELVTHYAEKLKEDCSNLLNIITSVIEISKVETNQIELNESHIDISEILKKIHRLYLPLAEQKNIKLYLDNHLANGSSLVLTDKEKLKHIISSLVSNALKFSSKGDVTIHAERRESHILLSVKDHGIGIAPQYHEAIFEQFRQVETDIARQYSGIGLGLSLSKAYVEKMGGKIWVDSATGQGATFYVTIPIKK
ncbi:GAF domain-containing protein [Puteibacter caeruleilacunae]|nr:GAF domain-containing protein [Puteibacter caeruleilacunae]